jgi:iron complex transport system ATP-binding protein
MSLSSLFFSYGGDDILSGVSLEFGSGKLTGLLGPNGSGKTTLFKCCLGLLKARQGSIELEGRALSSFSPKELARRVAYVPQEHRPPFSFTVREIVEMGRTPHRRAMPVLSKGDKNAVSLALERLGLASLADRDYSHLSGGQRQLVLVARALAQEAGLLFLDEPTSSLDFSNQAIVWEAVRSLARDGIGAVICCHDPNQIVWYCHEMAAIRHGRILAAGPAEETVTRELMEELYQRPVKAARLEDRTFIYPVIP